MRKHTILFLAANPNGTDRRALDREARAIGLELKRGGDRDRFKFKTRWAAEPLDLLRELRELKPAVVHFSGSGNPHGLVFQTAEGPGHVVSGDALSRTFGAAGSSVKLVVLSACYTNATAETLLEHVDCVVGIEGSIHEDAARSFAVGFYGALAEHESVAVAFQHGRAAIGLEGRTEADYLQLKVRKGCDASRIVLAADHGVVRIAISCPYPGMRPYSADDTAGFHGRGAEIEELIGRLWAGEREIYVIGPSGCGKSSLVAAGALPRLANGFAGSGPLIVRSMRPGEHPAARLAEVLGVSDAERIVPGGTIAALLEQEDPSSPLLVVIDQLEEIFALASADERDRFLLILQVLRNEPRCAVVSTLRADFFGAFMESPLWTDRQRRISRIEVAPLRGEALREAITRPARDVGVLVEPSLVERLLADAASEPGILPLLQETLVQLWDRRVGKTLTLAEYQAFGDGDRSGLAVALSRRADAVLRGLTPEQEGIARRIFLRLVSFGEGRTDTRRQQPIVNLRVAGDDARSLERVLQQLISARLLTTDGDDNCKEAHIDLAHEVMITAWPTLTAWIRTHRADELRRRNLESTASLWVERGRSLHGLLDSNELVDAEAWQQTESARQLGHSNAVRELIVASREAHSRQQRRKRRRLGGAFVTLAAFAAIATTFAVTARHRASENQRLLAQSYQEAGRQLLVDGHPYEAIPYLLAARQNGEIGVALQMLFGKAGHFLPRTVFKHPGLVVSAAFSPDGTRAITTSRDNTARIWDTATGEPITGPLQHVGWVTSASFSPDSSRVATASSDKTMRIWEAATGKPVTPPLEHDAGVLSVNLSPDGVHLVSIGERDSAQIWNAVTGKRLVLPGSVGIAAFSPDGARVITAGRANAARVWETATGKPLNITFTHLGWVLSARYSPDGTRVVTTSVDNTARIWDAMTGEPLGSPLVHQGWVVSAAFSPDSARIVTASDDKTARVWDAATGMPITSPLVHQAWVRCAAFNFDGTRVLTASGDETAQIWDSLTGEPVGLPLAHQEAVLSAAFSLDGTHVLTVSVGSVARIWDVAADAPLTSLLGHQEAVVNAVFSPNGARVVTASFDKTARVWDAKTGKAVTPPLEHRGSIMSAVFSPDGSRVVTASFDKTARVWDAVAGTPVTPPLAHDGEVRSAVFSRDGARIVTASADMTARVWEVATGKPITGPLAHLGWVVNAAFDHDGTRVVTTSFDMTARVWSVATGNPIAPPLSHQGWVMSATFSPDDTRVVTSSADGTARLWDAATGKPLTEPLKHQGDVTNAVFSPDGTRVLTASNDGTARIWDARTGRPLTNPLVHQGAVRSAAFSPDGTFVVTASADKTARVWDAATGKQLTRPLGHKDALRSAAFSPDGTRVITTSDDKTARIWDITLDIGTLDTWSRLAEMSPFVLTGGVHLRRSPHPSEGSL